MNLSEIRTDIEHQAWIRLLNDSNSLERGQLGLLSYDSGSLQFLSDGKCMMLHCSNAVQNDDIARQFSRGYSALATVTNHAKNGTYSLRIVYIHGKEVNLSDINLALDKGILEQAQKLKLGVEFKQVSQNLKSLFLFQLDKSSKDYYALAYLSQVASDEIKKIEQLEKNALNDGDISLNTPFKKAQANNLVLIGKKIQLAVGEYKMGEETYLACKRLTEKKRKEVNKAIRLVKLNLSFSDVDNPVVLQAFSKEQMQSLANQEKGYLSTWDRYGAEEGNLLLEKARMVDRIAYKEDGIEVVDGGIELFVNKDYRELLKANDSLELVTEIPEYLEDKDVSWEQYSEIQFNKYKQEIGLNSGMEWGKFQTQEKTSSIDEVVDTVKKERSDSLLITIKKVTQHSLVLDLTGLPENANLIYSMLGDQIQVERRMTARERISQGTSAMPLLGLIIEEEGVLPHRKRAPTITPIITDHVERKVFPKNKPTPIQKKAIDLALNTPDICIIQGPPGTGKTTVIAAIIERLNELADKKDGVQGNILISGYQHDAVDNVLSRLSVNSLPSIKFGQKQGEDSNVSATESKIDFWRHSIAQKVRDKHPELKISANYDSLHRLYQNYLTIPDTFKALRLLKQALDTVSGSSSSLLTQRCLALSYEITEQLRPKQQDELRCIRALRVSQSAFYDDGPSRAVSFLEKFYQELSLPDKSLLKLAVIWEQGKDLSFLKDLQKLKHRLLAKFKESVHLSTPKVRQDVVEVIQDCLSSLESDSRIKDPQNKILSNYLFELENNPEGIKKSISDYNLVYGATTGQSEGKSLRAAKVNGKGAITFDTVIIDEAARAAPRDLMIPMVQAENRIILVGDHRQLPHMIEDSIVESLQEQDGDSNVYEEHIKQSMFQYLLNRLDKLTEQDTIERTITLDAQFRSHPLLGEFASKTFYQPYGEAYRSPLSENLFSHQLKGIENKAAIWVDVPHGLGGEKKDNNSSTFRISEAKSIAFNISKWIDSEEGRGLSFGIISFYKAQVNQVFKELVKYGITEKIDNDYHICEQYKMLKGSNGKPTEERLRIGTVDSFQGMEFDVVLLSVVRSCNKKRLNKENIPERHIFGHLMSINRLCVSMTRQKRSLIAFGDADFVSSNRALQAIPQVMDFLTLCQTHGVIINE